MILIELLFALAVCCFLVLLIPMLIIMAGIAGIIVLGVVAPLALAALLAVWLLFPALHGAALVVLLIVIALLLFERRSRHRMVGRY